jgi:hypothetical protein
LSFVGAELKFVGCESAPVEYIIANAGVASMKRLSDRHFWGVFFPEQEHNSHYARAHNSRAAGTGPGSTAARFFQSLWNPKAEEMER